VPSLVPVGEIRAAAVRLAGVSVRTPLVPFPAVAPGLLVKPESLQPTGGDGGSGPPGAGADGRA